MPQQRLKAGFGVFFLLCGLFGANLFAFQNASNASSAKRIVFPGSAVSGVPAPMVQVDSRPQPVANEAAGFLAPNGPQLAAMTTGSVSETDLVRAVQRELQGLGYEAGGIDGVAGMTTRAAIMAFEWDEGLPLTGEPVQHTLQALLLGSGRGGSAGAASSIPPSLQAAQVIRSIQHGLTELGYGEFRDAGLMTAPTQRAIRLFEVREGLTETGRISGALASRVTRLTGEKRLAVNR